MRGELAIYRHVESRTPCIQPISCYPSQCDHPELQGGMWALSHLTQLPALLDEQGTFGLRS